MTQATVPTYVYSVYTATGCTVTAPGFPSFSVTCYPGMANSFPAPGDTVEISDPAATLVAVRTFNGALAALGLLGGGNTLPAGYTRLEYLESTGDPTEQYIITTACLGDESEVTFSAPSYNDTNRILGGGITGETYSYLVGIAYTGRAFVRLRNYEQSFVYDTAAGHDVKHVVYIGRNEVQLNGTVISAENYQMPEYPAGIRVGLFREIYWDASGTLAPGGAGRRVSLIYSFRNWRGGILRGDYIPALDPTGAPCMFDLVTRTPFYNAGTGDFSYPSPTATYSLRRVLPDLGKLTEHGLRRLYHVPEGYEGDMLQFAAEHGFCPIVEEERPAEGYWSPRWEEIGGVIYLRWVGSAPPEET